MCVLYISCIFCFNCNTSAFKPFIICALKNYLLTYLVSDTTANELKLNEPIKLQMKQSQPNNHATKCKYLYYHEVYK